MATIEERVQSVISEHLAVPVEDVVTGASLVDDLGADSLDLIELEMAMEEVFGLRFPETEKGVIEMNQLVSDVVALVSKQMEAA